MSALSLPQEDSIASLIESLVDVPVTLESSTKRIAATPETPLVAGLFEPDSGPGPRAALVLDRTLAVVSGCLLMGSSRRMIEEQLEGGSTVEAHVLEAAHEILNIFSSLFNHSGGPHFTLKSVELLVGSPDDPLSGPLASDPALQTGTRIGDFPIGTLAILDRGDLPPTPQESPGEAALLSGLDVALTAAAIETFEMLFGDGASISEGVSDAPAEVSAIIGLSGQYGGFLAVHCTRAEACSLAGTMLGSPVEDIDAEVCDAIGEIANVLAGSLKKHLDPEAGQFRLAIPSIIQGGVNLKPAGTDAEEQYLRVVLGSLQAGLQLGLSSRGN